MSLKQEELPPSLSLVTRTGQKWFYSRRMYPTFKFISWKLLDPFQSGIRCNLWFKVYCWYCCCCLFPAFFARFYSLHLCSKRNGYSVWKPKRIIGQLGHWDKEEMMWFREKINLNDFLFGDSSRNSITCYMSH